MTSRDQAAKVIARWLHDSSGFTHDTGKDIAQALADAGLLKPDKRRLPSKWDSYDIKWTEWLPAPTLYWSTLNVRDEDLCPQCGTNSPTIINRGAVTLPAHLIDLSSHRARAIDGPLIVLRLYRCTACEYTTVWDGEQWWELDETDYLDEGSYPH